MNADETDIRAGSHSDYVRQACQANYVLMIVFS